MKLFLSVAFVVFCSLSLSAARQVTSLDGDGWQCDGMAVSVPHSWNGIDGADGSPAGEPPPSRGQSIKADSYLRKAAVYTRELPNPTPNRRQFIRFEGASLTAEVRINGQLAGTHRGAFTAFTVEATPFLKPTDNRLEVKVDNRWNADIAPLSGDYTLQGGLYRSVSWIETPQVCIDSVTDGADNVILTPDSQTGIVTARVKVLGGPDQVFTYSFPEPKLWTPENPHLYSVRVAIGCGEDEDALEIPFGFRTVEFRDDGFYLNGKKRVLRGVNRHQDVGARGWAATIEQDVNDLTMIKELGAVAVRLAHYPQSRRVFDLCDQLGLLVWSEVPAINWLTDSPAFRENLLQQTREMVAQNRNHPSIFAWSAFNEIYNDVPEEEQIVGYSEKVLTTVAKELKWLDPTRPVVAASCLAKKHELNAIPEQLAFNAYPGWYGDGTMRDDLALWFGENDRKMLGIAEYGAGGNPFEHLDPLPKTRLDPGGPIHPEEVQLMLHIDAYRAITAEPRLWGTFIWAMFDFAADARREGGKNGINDKGLVTRDRQTKKDVYSFYHANWSQEPVLEIASKRLNETANEATRIVGFSNCGRVTLTLNGRVWGEQEPDRVKVVTWENVPLQKGWNRLDLTAGNQTATRLVYRR